MILRVRGSLRLRQIVKSSLALLLAGCAAEVPPAVETERTASGYSNRLGPISAKNKSDADQKALLLYKRVVGVNTTLNDPNIQAMSAKLEQGDTMGAAAIATKQNDFLNVTVKLMATKMSYRDEKPNHESNDFVAAMVGGVRDDVSAYEMMTGNFYYTVDPAKVPMGTTIRSDLLADFLRSNNHFLDFDRAGFNAQWLMRQDGMKAVTASVGVAAVADLPAKDASALLTSRAFTFAHAIAGTNRRMLEFTFREFMCVEMTDWSDTTRSDEFVGRDVDRYDPKFQNRCKGCHGQMDGFRGAFANIDFYMSGNVAFLKHSALLAPQARNIAQAEGELNFKTLPAVNGQPTVPATIASKMNHNQQVFTPGRVIVDDSWSNIAIGGNNTKLFGWRGEMKGNGINSFAKAIAGSERFPRCMAQRVFTEVCKREPVASDEPMLIWAGKEFEGNNYNFKYLFQLVSTQLECLGD